MNTSPTFLKNFAALVLIFAAMFTPFTYAQMDNTSMPSIQFFDKTYHLAHTSDPTPSYSKYSGAIYLPEGETLPHYTHALIVDQELGVSSVMGSVKYFLEITGPEVIDTDSKIIDRIEKLNTGQALLLFLFNEHNEGREVITDSNGRNIFDLIEKSDAKAVFLVAVFRGHDKERDEVVWDWTAYRYSLLQTADGKQGVRRLGYSRRHYGNEGVADFLHAIDIANPRSPAINALISASIP